MHQEELSAYHMTRQRTQALLANASTEQYHYSVTCFLPLGPPYECLRTSYSKAVLAVAANLEAEVGTHKDDMTHVCSHGDGKSGLAIYVRVSPEVSSVKEIAEVLDSLREIAAELALSKVA